MIFSKKIVIDGKEISPHSRTYIIAEAGVNHGGDLGLAKELIDVAAESQADAVKFQTFKAEHLILDGVQKAPYQKKTTSSLNNQFEMLKALEVGHEQNLELISYCKKRNITFLTTPFEQVSLEELDSLDLPAYKIASTDLTNVKFLIEVAKKGRPMLLSTGMSYLSEIEKALRLIHPYNKDVVLLQCTANYPVRDHEVNLSILKTLRNHFDILLGFSDHSEGVGAAPYAIPLGAKVIEKHFTMDRSLDGPDHKASLTPGELARLVAEIRRVDSFMGTDLKYPTLSELGTRVSLQKNILFSKSVKKGDVIKESDLICKRTGGLGVPAIYFFDVVGMKAERDFSSGDVLELG